MNILILGKGYVGNYLASENNEWSCEIHPISTYRNRIGDFKLIGDRLFYSKNKQNRLLHY